MKKVFLFFISAFPVIFAYYLLKPSETAPAFNALATHVVERWQDGFYPKEITILKGDTVAFVNKETDFFWPGSNTHPAHEIYSEFDSRGPVAKGESWSFTFEKAGSWGYHDHLAAQFLGTITVVDRIGPATAWKSAKDCRKLNDETKPACWDSILNRTLKEKGVKKAFEALVVFAKTEPVFIHNGCHRRAHTIGDAAYYEQFLKSGGDLEFVYFGPETVYCNYGYYHGFFEHYFRDFPEDKRSLAVQRLCETLIPKVQSVIPAIRTNCYHGGGHGLVSDPPSPNSRGDPQSMIGPALRACDKVSPTEDTKEIRECLQGAFNVIADWIWFNQYGLAPDAEDPFRLCRAQRTREHELACYYEFAMRVSQYVDDNITRVVRRYLTDDMLEDTELAETVVGTAMATIMSRAIHKVDYTEFISACKSIPESLRTPCIRAMVSGLSAHSEPQKEYVKVLEVCSHPLLVKEERDGCYDRAMQVFRLMYSPEKVAAICKTFDEQSKIYCKR